MKKNLIENCNYGAADYSVGGLSMKFSMSLKKSLPIISTESITGQRKKVFGTAIIFNIP